MNTLLGAFSKVKKLLASPSASASPSLSALPEVQTFKVKSTPASGIMFVAKPRGATDDIVRTAKTREEAQTLAKTSALIVTNKSKFLPRSGVAVRSRKHVIFDFKPNDVVIQMSLTSESDSLDIRLTVDDGQLKYNVNAGGSIKDMKPNRRAEHVETLRLALNSLSLLEIDKQAFTDRVPILQKYTDRLCEVARQKIDERQRPFEEEVANTAEFQKILDQVPTGSFVIRRSRGYGHYRTGMVGIYDGLDKLKQGERIYALTQDHADLLANALGESSAHARLAAMRLLKSVPVGHPAALPPEVASEFKEFKTSGDLFARLEMLDEIADEDTIGEVFLVNPKMIYTYSSYRLTYGYMYGRSWEDRLQTNPLALSRNRSSLPKRPPADLITLDGLLCVSDKAKSVLEGLNLGSSRFHHIQETDDYWAMEITETKSGPVPDESLYELNKSGQRSPLRADGSSFYSTNESLKDFAKRARFGQDDLTGPDVWLCDDFALGYRDAPGIVFSANAVKAVKKGKCKWYKRLHAVRVVDQ